LWQTPRGDSSEKDFNPGASLEFDSGFQLDRVSGNSDDRNGSWTGGIPGLSFGGRSSAGVKEREGLIPGIRFLHQTPGKVFLEKKIHDKFLSLREIEDFNKA